MKDIITNVMPLLILVLTYLVSYLFTKIKITEKVSTVINKAEIEYKNAQKAGNQKMDFAIDLLYSYVPVYLKPFVTKELIRTLIQKTFDEAEEYVNSQLDKVAEKINEKFDEVVK